MNWTIPGTVLTASIAEAEHVSEQFQAMFLAGGMVLSQVSAITGLEGYVIQNWVKRKFVSSPVKKLYSKEQFARIVIINMLRESLGSTEVFKKTYQSIKKSEYIALFFNYYTITRENYKVFC